MSSTENLAEEVPRRKMQSLIPLLREKSPKLGIQVRVLLIRNCCNTNDISFHRASSSHENRNKNDERETKRTEPESPILRPLQQFGTVEREELNHLVVTIALHGVDDVEA